MNSPLFTYLWGLEGLAVSTGAHDIEGTVRMVIRHIEDMVA